WFILENRKIIAFGIQYLTKINNKWQQVLRVDTMHGYAHEHKFHFRKKRHDHATVLSKNEADYDKIYHEQLKIIEEDYTKIKENYLL
ncbi:hypothetical protein KJ885_04795, partial [Patescibacteria group bacterium]|nr:hypothetical protein [Patescibacteria group bacterium]